MIEEKTKKDVVVRLKTLKGHIQGIVNMVEDEKQCEEVLLQITAIKASIEKIGLILIEDNARECLMETENSSEDVDRVLKNIIKFLR
ncbi:MAG: hypothetical protein COA82_03050 [Alkaliphilus sp.]|nr:metal-sensitive transcriptional regulator [bacterium AH-315-G05]PHS35786.1 MAG: hypothetical protein COA82_03050 [Alkaliphilus sp.]